MPAGHTVGERVRRTGAITATFFGAAVGLLGGVGPVWAENVEVVSTLPGGATAVAVEGSFAYVARGAAGVSVVNRSNPASPFVVASVLPGDGAAVYIRDVAVHDGVLWAVNWDDVENGATGKFTGVYAYDVSVPSAPVEISRIDWGSERFYHQAAMVYDVAVAEVAGVPYAFFVSEITNAVEVFNISDPSAPAYAASLERPLAMSGVCEDVAVQGDTAYVAWLQGGVTSFDLSDLAAIEANNALALDYGDLLYPSLLMQHKGAIGTARGLAPTPDGTKLAVTDEYGNGKLRLFDVSNPVLCIPLGTFDAGTAAGVFDVRIVGTRAYVAWGADGLRVIDVGNPLAPTQIARHDTANAKRSALAGPHVLLADGTAGLLTLGLKDQVAIVSATWSRKAKTLLVTATSTAATAIPPAVLTVTGHGTMTYSSTTGQYTLTRTGINTRPSAVTATSTWGGTASLPVTQIK
jgi:hypothetical protein